MTGIDDIEYFRKARAAQEAQALPADGYRIKELVECSITSIDDEGDLEMDDIHEIPRTDLQPKAALRVGGSREDFIRAMKEAYMPLFHEQVSMGVDVALPVRREVTPTSPGIKFKSIVGSYVHAKPEFHGLWSRAELDPTASKIPGARDDWAPSKVVTYEPDLGEDLEISTEEERVWRAKR